MLTHITISEYEYFNINFMANFKDSMKVNLES
jgi:hypothetical protein